MKKEVGESNFFFNSNMPPILPPTAQHIHMPANFEEHFPHYYGKRFLLI